VLDCCGGGYAAIIKRQSQLLFSALGFARVSFSGWFFFRGSPSLQFNLLALGNVCCPTRAVVLGLSFYPLEQAPNMVIYAMSKSGTATSGLIYVCGFLRPKPRTNARLLPKHSSAN
jgi:hypothetical protein